MAFPFDQARVDLNIIMSGRSPQRADTTQEISLRLDCPMFAGFRHLRRERKGQGSGLESDGSPSVQEPALRRFGSSVGLFDTQRSVLFSTRRSFRIARAADGAGVFELPGLPSPKFTWL